MSDLPDEEATASAEPEVVAAAAPSAAPAEPLPSPEPEPLVHPVVSIIDQWVSDCIHNSPVSYATDAFNHLSKALVELKRRLTKEV